MTITVALNLIGGLFALVLGGEWLVRGSSKLSTYLGIPAVVVGLTIVAFGTSAPELAVSVAAAMKGNADIAIANVVGSNIFNIFFILGISALVSPLIIHSTLIRREVPIMIISSIAVWLFSLNGKLERWEGLIFLVGTGLYTWWLVRSALKEKGVLAVEAAHALEDRTTRADSIWILIGLIVLGLGVIMVGAEMLVTGAVSFAKALGVSDTVIGLTIVAIGTSLPEVVASVVATIKGERDIAVGNVVGSSIYNIFIILGLSASLIPKGLTVEASLLDFNIPVMVAAAALCLPIFWLGRNVNRKEGLLFLSLYIAYTYVLISHAAQ